MIMKLGKNRYEFVKEFPLSKLAEFKNHKRLKVFFHKGLQCSVPGCHHVGTRFILGCDNGRNFHMDIYTDDLVLMNVDHRIPKCDGGTWDLDNLFPMCQPHNTKKGNSYLDENLMIVGGDDDYKKEIRSRNRYVKRWRKFIRKFANFQPLEFPIIYYTKIRKEKFHKVAN